MGYSTYFYGKLEFTRHLTRRERADVETVLNAWDSWTPEIRDAIWQRAEADRAARGGGPTMIHAPWRSELAANMSGFVVGEGLSAFYAGDLRVSDDRTGLVHSAENSYRMVEAVNFIVVNAKVLIAGFGLKGELCACTEFEPYYWCLKIGKDGFAYQEPTTHAEFLRFRRQHRRAGYNDHPEFGPVEPGLAEPWRPETSRSIWRRLIGRLTP